MSWMTFIIFLILIILNDILLVWSTSNLMEEKFSNIQIILNKITDNMMLLAVKTKTHLDNKLIKELRYLIRRL